MNVQLNLSQIGNEDPMELSGALSLLSFFLSGGLTLLTSDQCPQLSKAAKHHWDPLIVPQSG